MNLKPYFPILSWLPNYQKKWLTGDIMAGLTVGIILIPQGIAYATIAGLPPVYGLYASTFPLLIYAIFGTSKQLGVGPVALVSLLTASTLGAFSGLSLETYILYAFTLAFLVGVIQVLLGVFKLGFMVHFLSNPVVSGFTSAAAILIGFSQIKHLLGIDIKSGESFFFLIQELGSKTHKINVISLIIGLIGMFIIIFFKKWNRSFPGQLIAVIFGILVVQLFNLASGSNPVQIIGDIPQTLPYFQVIPLNWSLVQTLIPMAFTIAIISLIESISISKIIRSKRKDDTIDANSELIALGFTKLVGSFFQSYATSGGFSRTAVNNQAGAHTPLTGIFSAILVMLTLLFLTPLFFNLPNAILASIILVAVAGLIDYQEAFHLWKSDRKDFWMLFATFAATLALGIETGIATGVILSLVLVIYSTTYPHTAELAKVPNSPYYRNKDRFEHLECNDKILIYRFDAQLFYANIQHFKDKLYAYESLRKHKIELLVIDSESFNNIDSTSIKTIEDIVFDFQNRGIEVYFSSVKGPIRDKLLKSGFIDKLSFEHFFMSNQEAIDFFENTNKNVSKKSNFDEFICQTKQ